MKLLKVCVSFQCQQTIFGHGVKLTQRDFEYILNERLH